MYVRGAAVFALGEIDTDEAKAALTKFESDPGEPTSGTVATEALSRLQQLSSQLDDLREISFYPANKLPRWSEPQNSGFAIKGFLDALEEAEIPTTIEEINSSLHKYIQKRSRIGSLTDDRKNKKR